MAKQDMPMKVELPHSEDPIMFSELMGKPHRDLFKLTNYPWLIDIANTNLDKVPTEYRNHVARTQAYIECVMETICKKDGRVLALQPKNGNFIYEMWKNN